MLEADANIWATYTSIYANTMGLGTCFNGFIVHAMKKKNRLFAELGIPAGHRVYASLLVGYPKVKYVIFAAFVSRGNALQESLEASGIASAVVFGEMVVEHRVQNMNKYMSGEVRVLIGGEVVSRGLALQTDHVILFDVPHNLGQLLHKVGRTGVLGRPGKVSCFIKPDDESIMKRMLQDEKFEVSYPSRSKRKSTQERNFADAQLDHELSELSD